MAFNLEEYYDTGDDNITNVYGVQHRGQTITSTLGFDLSRVTIKAYRTGSPGSIQLDVYAVDGSHKPTGATLGTTSASANSWTTDTAGDWYDIDFVTPVTLSAATEYALVFTITGGDASNQVYWKIDTSFATYSGGGRLYSTNGGSSWTWTANADMMFRTYSGSSAVYIDISGTSDGQSSSSGSIGEIVDLGGSSTGQSTSSGFLTTGPLTGSRANRLFKRLVASSNNQLYYEDI